MLVVYEERGESTLHLQSRNGTKCVDGLATALSSTIISEGASHESPSSLEEAEEEEPRLKATNTERVIATTNIT